MGIFSSEPTITGGDIYGGSVYPETYSGGLGSWFNGWGGGDLTPSQAGTGFSGMGGGGGMNMGALASIAGSMGNQMQASAKRGVPVTNPAMGGGGAGGGGQMDNAVAAYQRSQAQLAQRAAAQARTGQQQQPQSQTPLPGMQGSVLTGIAAPSDFRFGWAPPAHQMPAAQGEAIPLPPPMPPPPPPLRGGGGGSLPLPPRMPPPPQEQWPDYTVYNGMY